MTHTAMIRPAWTPATIALMVLGFIIFWPLGLAMLAYVLWGDRLDDFKRDVNMKTDEVFKGCSGIGRKRRHHRHHARTGNVAFDDWREKELERLADERRKLEEMREEFDTYVRELRRAKDQEEFDRFMRERKNAQNGGQDNSGPSVPNVTDNY